MFTYKSITLAIFLSIFIYLEFIYISYNTLNTFFALGGFYLLFKLSKKELFGSGFLIGILWFWWLGYSFIYYELHYLIPIVILGIGIVYGILFYFGGLFDNLIYKVFYFFMLSFIEPFGFNWFKIELPLVNSYFSNDKTTFLIILVVSAVLIYFQKKNNKIGMIIYSISLIFLYIINQSVSKSNISQPNLKIYMQETDVSQDKKWDKKYKKEIIRDNIINIDNAIKKNYDLIIFPETSFPILLNKQKDLKNILLEKSKKISIILGALYKKDGLYYNSTYFFQDEQMIVAHKVVLVPFGEAVPLPQKIRDWINNMFYNGAKDYETAQNPTTFNIKNVNFRNAICYEATTDTIYQNLDTPYVIATSNNAWFTPSHQPILQKLLLKYYAKKYNLLIYNVTNKSKSGIIHP